MRECSTCFISKPLTDFGRNAALPGGRRGQCKACVQVKRAAWEARNPEKVAAYNASKAINAARMKAPIVPTPDYTGINLATPWTPAEQAFIDKCRATKTKTPPVPASGVSSSRKDKQ